MTENIIIPQKAILQSQCFKGLSIIDWVVLMAINEALNSDNNERLIENGSLYLITDYKSINDLVPILNIGKSRTKQIVSALCNKGLIEKSVFIKDGFRMALKTSEAAKKAIQDIFYDFITEDSQSDLRSSYFLSKNTLKICEDLKNKTAEGHSYIIYPSGAVEKFYKDSQLLYLMKDFNSGYYKIGVSTKPKKREKTLASVQPKIELIWSYSPKTTTALTLEKSLHEIFKKNHIRGEWFGLTEKDVEYIKNLDI